MEFFKKRSDVFFKGVGAEFVFKTSDGISLVSGGRVLKVRVAPPSPGHTESLVVLAEPDGNEHIIFRGDAVTASARFIEIARDATSVRPAISSGRKGLYAVLAAFTAVYLIFCHPTQRAAELSATQASVSDLNALIKSIPSVAGGVGVPNLPTMDPQTSAAIAPTGSPVLDKPSFLSLPEDEVPEAAEKKLEGAKETTPSAIPAYSEDLYSKPAATAVPGPETKSGAEVSKAEGAATESKAPVAENVLVAKADGQPGTADKVVANAEAEKVAPVAATPAIADAKPIEQPAAKATEGKPEVDATKAAKDATKNMSATETADLLKQIEQMMTMDPSAITPEMLAKLPHEIAQTLRATGVIGSPDALPEKGNAPYAAIRLPAGVIDKFRGKDGIASIPENDTFAALGNKISLQLPGGGDIRKPEDLKLFGFKP
jgi:hypothetical protein